MKKNDVRVCFMFKKIADISNSSIVKNADALLSKKPSEMEIEWTEKS